MFHIQIDAVDDRRVAVSFGEPATSNGLHLGGAPSARLVSGGRGPLTVRTGGVRVAMRHREIAAGALIRQWETQIISWKDDGAIPAIYPRAVAHESERFSRWARTHPHVIDSLLAAMVLASLRDAGV